MRRERDNPYSAARRAASARGRAPRHDSIRFLARRTVPAPRSSLPSSSGRRAGERPQALARGLEQLLEAHRVGAVALVAQDAGAAVDVVGAAELQVEVEHLVGGQRPRASRCASPRRRGPPSRRRWPCRSAGAARRAGRRRRVASCGARARRGSYPSALVGVRAGPPTGAPARPRPPRPGPGTDPRRAAARAAPARRRRTSAASRTGAPAGRVGGGLGHEQPAHAREVLVRSRAG